MRNSALIYHDFSQLPHMRTTISPDLWIVYIPEQVYMHFNIKCSEKDLLRRKLGWAKDCLLLQRSGDL